MVRAQRSKGVISRCLKGLACVVLFTDATAQQGWSVQHITAENGLPQNSVRSLAMDGSGYLWMTTEGGLVRYDGRLMRVFSTRNDSDLLDDRLQYLMQDRTGALFVNDAAGSLYRVTTGSVTREIDGRGKDKTLAIISGGVTDLVAYRAIAETPLFSTQWRAWDLRILPLPEGGFAAANRKGMQVTTDQGEVWAIEVPMDQQGAFMSGGELFVLAKDKSIHLVDRRRRVLRTMTVSGVDLRLAERALWSSTGRDVFVVGSGRIWHLASRTGSTLAFEELAVELPLNTILNAAVLSPDGNSLFIGTSTRGLFRYTRHRFSTLVPHTAPKLGQDNSFYAQAAIGGGRVLTSRASICTPDGFVSESFPILPCEQHVLLAGQRDRLWSARGDTVRVHAIRDGQLLVSKLSSAGSVTVMLEERDTVWVAGSAGLEAWVGLEARPVLTHRVFNYRSNPFDLMRGPDGFLWWATGHGVYRVNGDRLVPVQGLENTYARTLFRWGERVLVGTYGEGVIVIEGNKVVHLPLDPQGGLSHVHAFIPDARGRIWMPTNHGLFVVRAADLEDHLSKHGHTLGYRSFGRSEGLGTLEFNGGCSPPYVRLPTGEVSLPTIDGLVRFVPEAIQDDPAAFEPFIDELRQNGAHLGNTRTLNLLGTDRLTLRYALPCWTEPADLQLFYRVRGLDTAWVRMDMASDLLTVERLPPGNYTLQMMRHGAAVRDLLSIHVMTPWYRSPWTMGAGLCLLLGLGWLLVRVRTDRLLRAQAKLEAIVEDRTMELQRTNGELTRALGVKDRLISILSHDIVSPLRFISRAATRTLRSARSEKPEVLRHTLAEISSSSEKLYANASNILEWIRNQGGEIAVVPVDVEARALAEEVLAQFQQHATTVRFINEVPHDDHAWVDPRLFGIVLQNLVANAAGHAGGLVTVEGERIPAGYRVTVKDNGPGMSAAAQQRIHALHAGSSDVRTATDRPGLGYMIIHDILSLLGGSYSIETPPSGGTWVHVHLPVKERPEPNG
jgi:signal transduction histidine kinase